MNITIVRETDRVRSSNAPLETFSRLCVSTCHNVYVQALKIAETF